MVRRILRELRIDKVAAVDRPCQEHASADIMKRDFTQAERDAAAKTGAALPDGSFPIHTTDDLHNAIHAIGRAKDEATAKAHIISRAKALGATDQLPGDWSTSKQESAMLKELAKALGLPETATEADVAKAVNDNIAKNAETATALEKVRTELAEMVKAAATKKPMPDPDGDNDASPDGVAKGLAFQAMDGSFISKKQAGAMFDILKSQDAQLRKNAEDIAKRDEDAANIAFAKRATDIGFGAEFGSTLRKAYGGDAQAQAEVEKRIKGLQTQVEQGALFKNFGGGQGPAEGSAGAEFMAKVEEIQKAHPELSEQQAYAKAYVAKGNRDIVKRMKAEASA